MQRLSGDFTVKRIVTTYSTQGGGVIVELYELPNGQWQFGKGKDAVVVTTLEQVAEFDSSTKDAVAKWLDRVKALPTPPAAVVQGGQPASFTGESSRDQLSRLLSRVPDSVVDRLLGAITQTLEPIADSLTQPDAVNSHVGGFGDASTLPPGAIPFSLPEGASWADPARPESGYFTLDYELAEKATLPDGRVVDVPSRRWHPTPQFHEFVRSTADKTDIELAMDAEREKFHAEQADSDADLVGAGSGRASSRRARSRR